MSYISNECRQYNRYSDFRQAARRHAPSQLIPVIAAAAAEQTYEMDMEKWARGIPPWAYAAIARDCMVHSDERRHRPVTDQAVARMRNLLLNAHEPDQDLQDIFRMVSGYVYEQALYQRSLKHEMARSYLLFVKTEVQPRYSAPDADSWADYLGVQLDTAMTATFILAALTATHSGTFDPQYPLSEDYRPMEGLVRGADL